MIADLLELAGLLRNLRLSEDELRSVQESKLRFMVRHAFQNVPYYRELFTSAGLSPEDIRSQEDLRLIPITRKEDLRAAGVAKILAAGIDPSGCRIVHTSGSTGKPFAVYMTPRESATRRSLHFRALLMAGFRPLDRLASFGLFHPASSRFHERLGLYRNLVVSPLIPMNERLELLRKWSPTVLWSFPGQLRIAMHHTGGRLSDFVHPRMLITSSENFDPWVKERVLADLGAGHFDFYGCMEIGRLAHECPSHEGLHVAADRLILECLQDGKPAEQGKTGTVVVTALDVFTMPFIRYELGDLSSIRAKRCSCGRAFPLISPPEGRNEDVLRLPSGRMETASVLTTVLREFSSVSHFRVVQESVARLVVQVVLAEREETSSFGLIHSRLLERLGEPMTIDIEEMESIPEQRGEFRAFVSRLDQKEPRAL